MKWLLAGLAIINSLWLSAQDIPIGHQKYIYFPFPAQRGLTASIGLTGTTMPYEITEEIHYRIPAGDFHFIKKITKNLLLDGRADFQVIQNLFTLGPHLVFPLTDRVCAGIGDDIGFWFGIVQVQGFNTRGTGWQQYPNASLGYRFNKRILLTLKGEALINQGVKTFAGQNQIKTQYSNLSGSAFTVVLEQPFYGHKSISLGFRGIYTSFFWQTWSAFTTFDRKFFYPQLIIGLIL